MIKTIKSIIILLLFTVLILSCGANPARDIAKTMDKVFLGMTINEFRQKIKDEELLIMKNEITIYKKNIKSYNYYAYGIPVLTNTNTRFFYFEDNKLVKVDGGERALDYKVQIDYKDLNK